VGAGDSFDFSAAGRATFSAGRGAAFNPSLALGSELASGSSSLEPESEMISFESTLPPLAELLPVALVVLGADLVVVAGVEVAETPSDFFFPVDKSRFCWASDADNFFLPVDA
jgi:hypothetical protein